MKCKNCGEEIESKLLYCPKCGESIQLVPEYDVLEEELLSKVVEDKNKSKEKFATGVYKTTGSDKTSNSHKKVVAPKEALLSKRSCILLITFLLIISIGGTCLIAAYANKHSYDNLMNSAIKAEEGSQYAKALGYYEEAYNIKTDSYEAIYGLGRMYFKVKEYKNAVEYLTIALNYEPDNKTIYSYLLQSYVALKDYDSIHALADNAPNEEIYSMISSYFVSAPTFSDEGGEYDTNLTIYLKANNGDQIFYTTNGKNPVTSGKLYSDGITLKEGTTEIKAVSVNSEGYYSDVVSETYVIEYAKLSTPAVSPEAGTYTELQYISIAVPDNATAYYTWDGSDPAENGIEYTEPFPIISGDSVLSVVIIDANGNQSPLYRGEYHY